MGDLQGISKARRELEELYSGIPDDSVNLTFQDFAEVRQQQNVVVSAAPLMDPTNHIEPSNNPRKEEVSPLTKLPSLDFNRALKATTHARSDHPIQYQNNQHNVLPQHHPLHAPHHVNVKMDNHVNHHHVNVMDHHASQFNPRGDHHHHAAAGGFRHGMDGSMAYDDVSGMSMASMSGFSEINGRRRRPGIPHSNICTVCSTYIYIFRHRCLVCGRVYCRQCVGIGMGDMAEGRKCIECLGKRFSQRYIQRAGEVGCCMGYPSTVKQQELKWAEKGPRRTGEDRYGRSGMVMSRSRSPNPRRPTTPPSNNNSNSFVMMNSPYSPYYSPTNHPLPF